MKRSVPLVIVGLAVALKVAVADVITAGPHADWLSITVLSTGKTYRFDFDNLGGFLGPSSDPASQSPLVNEDETPFGVTCQPETKSGVVHLFYKNSNSEIREVADLQKKLRQLFPEDADHLSDFVRVQQIRGRTVSLTSYYGFEPARKPQSKELNVNVEVGPEGALSRVSDHPRVAAVEPADAEEKDDFLPLSMGVWPSKPKTDDSTRQSRGLLEIEEIEDGGTGSMKMTSTIKRKGYMLRSDAVIRMVGQVLHSGTIRDGRTGDLIALDHDKRTYLVQPAKDQKQQLERKKRADPDDWVSEQPKPTSTGRKGLIEGHEVEEYVCKTRHASYRWWVSRELAHFAPIANDQYGPIYASQYPDEKVLPGVPLLRLQEVHISYGPGKVMPQVSRRITKLLSIGEAPVDDSEFQIPVGYRRQPH